MDIKELFGKATIKGKEYIFPKPKVLFWINLEDSCFDSATKVFNEFEYKRRLLDLVTKEVEISDLVEYKECTVELSSGVTLKTKELEYENYFKVLSVLSKKLDRIKTVKYFLEICGSEVEIDTLTYEEINIISNKFKSIFEAEELTEVILQIESFR